MPELTTAEKLAEAKTALHKLLTGSKMVRVGYENTQVEYTEASIDQLRQYIAQLEGEVDPCKARRPFGVTF